MARNDPQVNFRMPQELRDKLESAAKANSRTLTAEIVARLERSFAMSDLGMGGDALDLTGYLSLVLSLIIRDDKDNHIKPEYKDLADQITQRLGKSLLIDKSGQHNVIIDADLSHSKK